MRIKSADLKNKFCSRVSRLLVLPWCRERPQTTICCLEWFEELNQFITAVNSFHPALKYTWEISDTCLAFLDIKLSIEGNGLHYKPTGSHSYLLYSSSHPSHSRITSFVETRALFWKRLRLRGYFLRKGEYTFNCSHVRIETLVLLLVINLPIR